ncbi:MAG TPA: DUF134 domain-containing protein [Phycisphaerae bacterium]|nr:DUF134 domain-containing protein [Phycisphaerae bacterium]
MGRPPIPRVVRCSPGAVYYKPRGIPLRVLEEVVLGLDEMEALRLADVEGLEQEEMGRRMKVSRATAGRILETAHRKVADALVGGKALRIEGGPAQMPPGFGGPFPGGPMGPGGGFGRGGRGRGGRGGRGRGGPPWA